MRLPKIVSEKATKATKKKPLEAVSIFGDAGTALEEFGITESGNEIQAYVKVSPRDPIILGFEIPCMEAQIVDLFIDGVLRESIVTTSRPLNIHRGKIAEVCVCEIRPSGAKGKLEYSQMVVEDRKTTKDIPPSAPGFEDLHTSAVGTIEVRVLREMKSAVKSNKDIKPEQAERGPTFEDNLRWWNVSRRVDPGNIAPTYQIGFINGRKTHGSSRKNINRSIEGYYLWASFKFLYRSASDIQAAGFDNGDLSHLSSNIKAERSTNLLRKMEDTQSATATTIDGKPILTLKNVTGVSAGQIGSGSLQQLESGPVEDPHGGECTGYLEQIEEEFQVVTPAKYAPTPDGIVVVTAGGDREASEIAGHQRYFHAYCETEHSDDEADQSEGLLEIANREKVEYEQPYNQKLSKRAPLPGSRRAAAAISEQAIASYVNEADLSDVQAEETMPILSQSKNVREMTASDKSPECEGGRSTPPDKQEWDRRIKKFAQAFSPEINPKCLKELSSSPQVNPVKTMMRAKAGHYMSRSPLVDPDTEDIKRQAKAMTNGKGNWPSRISHLVQNLSTPSENRAMVKDLPSTTTRKRNFAEINADADGILRPGSCVPYPLGNQNLLGISPKERREELARKKRVKQEILEKARAKADALRQQVEEIEARQDEALAQEEAELEKLDMEIDNIEEEAHALAARLRELHDQ